MGIKLRVILILLIGGIVSVVLLLKIQNSITKKEILTKELEFTQTTFTEVDTTKVLGVSFGTFGVRDKGILYVDNLVYHTDKIEKLTAKKGKYDGIMLYLDGDVVMREKEGYLYTTQHAKYNQKSAVLDITSAFVAIRDKNSMKGETLRYYSVTQEVFATKVNGVFYTAEK